VGLLLLLNTLELTLHIAAMYLPQNQVIPAEAFVDGDHLKFAQYAPIWRRVLEVMHIVINGPTKAEMAEPELDDDAIVGRYAILNLPKWGG
jgi:hypothetical protein